MPHPLNDKDIEQTALAIKAVAQPLRLAIVCLLVDGERSVGEICESVGTSQPNITHHLNQLHNLKLLTSRKEANRVFYAIGDPRLADIVGQLRQCYCPADPGHASSAAPTDLPAIST